MVQLLRVFAAPSDGPSSIPRTYIVEEENWPQFFSHLHAHDRAHRQPTTHTHGRGSKKIILSSVILRLWNLDVPQI